MSKTMTLSLGGKDRTLDFGKWWFTKYYGQAAGVDPLNSTDILLKPEAQFDFVVNIVYAGLKTWHKVEKVAEDFTKEEVENWIGEKESEEVQGIINDYGKLMSVSGEAPAPVNGA
jgi:hypothetical protein